MELLMFYRVIGTVISSSFLSLFLMQAQDTAIDSYASLSHVKFHSHSMRDKRSFVKRTHDYFYTAINGLEHVDSVRHLISIAESITPKLSLSNCIRILDSSYSLYQQALQQLEDNEAHKAQIELVYCALLSRVSVVLSSIMKTQLLTSLTTLDHAIQYWEFQRHHPFYYLFHKSPKKWLNKEPQSQEINQKLEKLYAINNEYSRMLGLLSSHLDFFSGNESVEKQCQWLAQLVAIAHQICGNNEWTPDGQLASTRVQVYIQEVIPLLLQHPQTFNKSIKSFNIPPHIERYWMLYLAAAGAGALTARYFSNHPGKIDEWKNGSRQAVANVYHTHLQGPLQRIKGAVWDKKIDVDVKNWEKDIMDGFKEIEQSLPSSESTALTQQKLKDDYRKMYDSYFSYLERQKLKLPDDVPKYDGADTLEIDPLLRLLTHVTDNTKNVWSLYIKDHVAQLVSIVNLIIQIPGHHTRTGMIATKNIIGQSIKQVAKRASEIELLLLQNRLNFAAILLLPVIGICYGGFKVIKKVGSMFMPSSYDYHLIKNGIDKIANILLESKEEDAYGNIAGMNYTSLGKLIYCTHALQSQSRYIPENKRDQFLHHLACLNSSYLTVSMKYDYVDQMYREYSFLWQPNHKNKKIYKL